MTVPSLQRTRRRSPLARAARHARFEPLEDRRLLALTIITNEGGFSFPAWVYDMGAAVARRDGWFDPRDQTFDGIADVIQNSVVNWRGFQSQVGAGQSLDDLLLFDWTEPSLTIGAADSDQVAGVLAALIHNRLAALDSGVLDLHFIAHGRGALVHTEALRRLATYPLANRIGFVQLTTLDPLTGMNDGILEANPGGIVDFADNYYQDIADDGIGLISQPILGALNFRLNNQIAAWSGRQDINLPYTDHNEVHDWYHWTIDSRTVAVDSPRLVDGEIPVPSAADRAMLYDTYVADLNYDGQLDDFGGGANIGYYFSIAGGAIGNIVRTHQFAFTIDVATGAVPLVLGGDPTAGDGEVNGLAYAPNGDIYYLSSIGSWVRRARSSFDANNEPSASFSGFGGAFDFVTPGQEVGLRFLPDGGMYVASQRSLWRIEGTPFRPTELFTATSLGSSEVLQALAFDQRGDAYAVVVDLDEESPTRLIAIDRDFGSARALVDLPHDDVVSLSMIGGLLYAFRASGAYFSYNLVTGQFVSYAAISHPAIAAIQNAASLVTLAQPAWHNRNLREDVNGDGRVTAGDLVLLVNTVLRDGVRLIDSSALFSYHYDVTNDGRISVSDLLAVINHILLAEAETAPAALSAAAPLTAPALEMQPQPEGLAGSAPLATMPTEEPAAASSFRSMEVSRAEALRRLAFATAIGTLNDEAQDPWAIRIL